MLWIRMLVLLAVPRVPVRARPHARTRGNACEVQLGRRTE